LKHDASDDEWDFFWGGSLGIPVCEHLDITRLDFFSIAVAEHGFEDDTDADRELRDGADAGFFD
jgi:hypothetical protein